MRSPFTLASTERVRQSEITVTIVLIAAPDNARAREKLWRAVAGRARASFIQADSEFACLALRPFAL